MFSSWKIGVDGHEELLTEIALTAFFLYEIYGLNMSIIGKTPNNNSILEK